MALKLVRLLHRWRIIPLVLALSLLPFTEMRRPIVATSGLDGADDS